MDLCHRRRIWSSLDGLLCSGPSQAFVDEFDAVGVVDEIVQNGVRVSRIADDFVPSVDRKLRVDDGGFASVVSLVPRLGLEAGEFLLDLDSRLITSIKPHFEPSHSRCNRRTCPAAAASRKWKFRR